MTERSQNGYPAGPAKSIGAKSFAIPGRPDAKILLRADVAPLFLEMARWLNVNVEKLVVPGLWGYAYRPIRGQSTGLSNHASGTAMDYNAPKHPLAKRNTWSATKRAAITAKAASLGLRWGANYIGRVDEMHFELNVNLATALKLVAKLQGAPAKPVTTKPSTPSKPVSGTRPIIRKGSTGQAVRDLQARLNRDYPAYSRLTVDGQFGPATNRVVREFQRRAGLGVDGIVGPKTWARLGF